MTTMMYIVYA